MKTISRYIMTLVALFALTTGAWAEDNFYLVVDGTSATLKYGSDKGADDPYLSTGTLNNSWEDAATARSTATTITVDATCKNFQGTSLNSLFLGFTALTSINNLENLNMANVTNISNMFRLCSSLTAIDVSSFNTAQVTNMNSLFHGCTSLTTLDLSNFNTASVTTTIQMFYGCSLLENIYVGDGWNTDAVTSSINMFTKCSKLLSMNTANPATDKTNAHTGDGGYLKVKSASSGPEVTYNDAKTSASFAMPAYDATVSYELVRDMTVDVDATIADRIRIKKENNVYVVVTDGQLTPAVSDKISGTAVAMTATTDYTVKLQKKVEGDTPSWTDATALSVGTFRYVITGANLYDGEITTTEFQLFEGYEVTIPAGEYATYYRTDDNLKIAGENTGGKLYTITGVSGSTATATEITSANKAMPFLIYNGNTEAKTFLLIPTDTEIDQTFYAGFVGTAEATTIAASSATSNNYAFNGKQFVWVKTEIAVGANKCWLAIPTGVTSNARAINLVFGNTTGIESIDNSELTIDGWYDLNGRKLQGKPTKKGIYIHNGKKVVVRK